MKRVVTIFFILGLFLPCYSFLNAQKTNGPVSFDQFYNDSIEVVNGYFPVYCKDKRYYLEIPEKSLNKDLLVTTQVIKGYSSLVGASSGVIHFSKGRNDVINVTYLRAVDMVSDSVDLCMMNAVKRSNLLPVNYQFKIVSLGDKKNSYIFDLTDALLSPQGLFGVGESMLLSRPDPSRSGVEKCVSIDKGVAFSVYRSQTDYQKNPNGPGGMDIISSFELQMTLQELPSALMPLRDEIKSIGFNTVSRREFSVKKYNAVQKNYIQRWNLYSDARRRWDKTVEPSRAIVVYLDPLIPKPFVESVKKGFAMWEKAFEKAGWKNVFMFTSDEKESALSYRHIIVRWGNAYATINSSVIVHPLTGEILTARLNVMDAPAGAMMNEYFVQCGLLDKRITKDIKYLDIRKEIMSVQIAAELARILGLKPHPAAASAYSPEDLRSNEWLKREGISASISSGVRFNYLAQPSDRISSNLLLPQVGVYDEKAIMYAYGNPNKKVDVPLSLCYVNPDKYNPKTQDLILSNDPVKAAELGLRNIKELYPQFPAITADLSSPDNTIDTYMSLAKTALGVYQRYITHVASLIGGRYVYPIIKGVNEEPVRFVPREQQVKALRFIEDELFTDVPEWIDKQKNVYVDIDETSYMGFYTNAVITRFLDKEVLSNLIKDEQLHGDEAYTVRELFDFLDRVIFENYNPNITSSLYKQNLQASLVLKLVDAVNGNNIIGGVNSYNALLNIYLLEVAEKILFLSEHHKDDEMRNVYRMLMMKIERGYFNKDILN